MAHFLRYLDISTRHISPETLNGGSVHHHIADYEAGAFFYVPDEIDEDCPRDLGKVLEYAKTNGCSIVRFDGDADTVDTLPFYEWE